MAVPFESINDVVTNLLPKFQKVTWVSLIANYTKYVASTLMLGFKGGASISDHLGRSIKPPKRVVVESGKSFDWRVQVAGSGAARFVSPYEPDTVATAGDMFVPASVALRYQDTHWMYSRTDEIFMKGDQAIIDELKARKFASMMSLVEQNEQALWTNPADSTSKRPLGIPHWIVKNATAGFNGGNPSGYTSGAAGISSSTYSAWNNYTDTYSAVTVNDAVAKIELANWETEWEAPVTYPSVLTDLQRVIFTTKNFESKARRLAETRNDNLGYELIAGKNRVTIDSAPVVPVKYLSDTDTTDPVYGVDFDTFRPLYNPQMDLFETTKMETHNTWSVWYDLMCNYLCFNRRHNYVLYKV